MLSPATGAAWLEDLHLRSFRLALAIGTFCLSGMAARSALLGRMPVADVANALFMLLIYLVSRYRPAWFRTLAWSVLLSFFINAVDGLTEPVSVPLTPAHMLLPLLVLYGALLGSRSMSLVALFSVLVIYGSTALAHAPLSEADTLKLTNLALASIASSAVVFGVWYYYRQFLVAYHQQATNLVHELSINHQLNAVLFHDISNPLTSLFGRLELAQLPTEATEEHLRGARNMARRIMAVIDSVRCLSDHTQELPLEPVPVNALAANLHELLAQQLEAKTQTLNIAIDGHLEVMTNRQVVGNSVLANLLSNAMKFSPRGSEIRFIARREGRWIRLTIEDQGPGLPEEFLNPAASRGRLDSELGTEQEIGHGFGLGITALYIKRLQGHLEMRNRPEGGGCVSVVLPAA